MEHRTGLSFVPLRDQQFLFVTNNMSLCIVDSKPLDVMESTLADLDFGAIENKGVERKEWLESPYGEEQLGKRIE
ncbi:hypothetical protein COOONC_09876, partial [Cooperia oncophora]